ncbi:MFS general substrate transporter [Gautieria morchelliformis]|nr:MFS general substrate transporter [Gautieria morchelliformis]
MSDPHSLEKAPTESVYIDTVEFDREGGLPPAPPLELTLDQERKLYRKIDLRLMPILILMYIVSAMDAVNIGNAKVAGLATQLNLVGNQFNIALAYCFCQCPANLLLKKIRPSRWLPGLTLGWGIVMTVMGLVKTYPQLICTRIFLGVFEAGLFPGVFRVGLFVGRAGLSLGFSGLLAFIIGYMNGVRGLEGWSWIFILEGSATVVVGILAAFILVDFPATAGFLNPEERAYIVRKMKYDNSTVGEEEKFAIRYVWAALFDWQLWPQIIIYMSISAPRFGYSTSVSQLLTVPVYSIATIVALFFGYYSDKLRRRFPFILAGQLMLLVGLAIEISPAPGGGGMSAVPGVVSWLGNNMAGQYKRGVGMAVHVGLGNTSRLIATNVFRTQDAPRYILGYSVELIFMGIGICCSAVTIILYMRINAHRDLSALAYSEKGGHGYTTQELRAMGDRAPDFRYTI